MQIIKLLEDNTGENLNGLVFGDEFLDIKKALFKKEKNW